MILMECCGGKPIPPMPIAEQPTCWCVHLIWALALIVVVLIIALVVRCWIKQNLEAKKQANEEAQKHEHSMKEMLFNHEKELMKNSSHEPDKSFDAKKKEFEELTRHEMIINKIAEKCTGDKLIEFYNSLQKSNHENSANSQS